MKVNAVNRATLRLFEAGNRAELQGTLSKILRKETYDVFIDEMQAIADNEPSFEATLEARTLRDNRLDTVLRWTVVPGYEKTYEKVLLSLFDITALRRLQRENEQIQKQLLQSQKMEAIGTLAGGVAHDFNNLLTAVIGHANLATLFLNDPDKIKDHLDGITTAARRAASLTRQLLLFSRKQPMGSSPINVNNSITNLLKMLRRLIGEHILIATDLEPGLNIVQADEVNVEQVITNLVVNARDAVKEGGKIIVKTENIMLRKDECRMIPDSYAGRFVRITVEDNGTGMDKETLAHIFEPFYTTKPLGEGTGLGLSVVYGILKHHKGWMNVYSELGKGSVFKVYLPAVHSTVETAPEKRTEEGSHRGRGECILLIEDDELVRTFAANALRENNYTVLEAGTATGAFEAFKREQSNIQLILSDIMLPDRSGIDLAEDLDTLKPGIPVIFTSGYLDNESQWPKLKEKGYTYIQKPFDLSCLLQTIERVLQQS